MMTVMTDFVNAFFSRVSSYQFFNFMLPGACFLGVLKFFLLVDIKVDENVWWFLLASYVLGLILSRIGSIAVEGTLRRLELIEKYDVCGYVTKRKDDTFVETLLALANLYRTLAASCLVLIITMCAKGWCCEQPWWCLVVLLPLLLFMMSFVKQSGYFTSAITK